MVALLTRFASIIRRSTTIKARLYLFSAILLAFSYISYAASLYIQHTSFVKERRLSTEYIVDVLLPKIAARSLRYGSTDDIEDVSQTLVSSTFIRGVTVTDRVGAIFYELQPLATTDDLLMITSEVYDKKISTKTADVFDDSHVVEKSIVSIGTIRAYIDESAISSAALSSVVSSSLPTLIIAVLAIPFVIVLGISLTRPLRDMVGELERFERGQPLRNIGEGYVDEYGRLARALARASDEIKRKTDDLEHQVETAIQERQVKEETLAKNEIFIAKVSNEIKYPLAGAMSSLDMLDRSIFDVIEKIENQPHLLNSEILQLGKLAAGAKDNISLIELLANQISSSSGVSDRVTSIVNRPVNLVAAIAKLLDRHRATAQQKGLSFDYKCSIDDDVWAMADWLEVAQIVNVLVSNAVEYTNSGYIKCSTKLVVEDDVVHMYFYVADSGIGLGAAKPYVSDLLNNMELLKAPPNHFEGTGLKIAKRVCDRLEGVLSLRATSSTGTIFFFECCFDKCKK